MNRVTDISCTVLTRLGGNIYTFSERIHLSPGDLWGITTSERLEYENATP